MLRYQLMLHDVGAIRFSISPLSETVRSLRALRRPAMFPHLAPWIDFTSKAVGRLDPLLACLVNDDLWTPDCLTQPPRQFRPTIADELRDLGALDPFVLRSEVRRMHGELPRAFEAAQDPVQEVVDALQRYWRVALAPHWSAISTALEADVDYRGSQITRRGLAWTLNDISPTLRMRGETVTADVAVSRTETLEDQALTLMPSIFSWDIAAPSGPGRPFLLYGARGQATIWYNLHQQRAEAVQKLIGARRSELLQLLASPASSTELAGRLGVSVAAINQHLKALQRAGLLTASRKGRHMLYRNTELGASLVGRQTSID